MLAYSSQGSPIPILSKDMDCRVKKAQISFVFNRLFSGDRAVFQNWLGGKGLKIKKPLC